LTDHVSRSMPICRMRMHQAYCRHGRSCRTVIITLLVSDCPSHLLPSVGNPLALSNGSWRLRIHWILATRL